MLSDFQKGAQTEIEFINGYIARVAAKHGLQAPVNCMLTDLIKMKEELEKRR